MSFGVIGAGAGRMMFCQAKGLGSAALIFGRVKNSGRIVSAHRSGSQYRLGKSGYLAVSFNGTAKSANGLSARMANVGTPPPPPCQPPPCQPPPCQPPPCQPPPCQPPP